MEKIKIAIIDDSQQMKNIAEEHFANSEEFDLVYADGNGATAFEEISKALPDVVLLDLVLPNKDGFAVLGEIKTMEHAPKVIITSALTGDTFIHRAMQLGANDYVVKPFDIARLDEHIKNAYNAENSNTTVNLQSKVDKLVESYARKPIKNRNLEERISNIFITVGIPAHIKGYQFLREAIKMAIKKYNLNIPVYGMVKNDKHQTRALMDENRNEFEISQNLMNLITKFQDTVHDTAITYHRKLRDKQVTKSALDDIQGIGEVKKKELLKHFGSVKNIKEASLEELTAVKGITEKLAKKIKEL